MVEENGFNFSSGERQKILLARALLKNSDIYIFDEAFHQIDILQEGIILQNIFSYAKGKVVLSFSEFQMLSSGYYLYLVPIKKLPIFYEKNSLLFFVKNFCYRYRLYLFFIFIFSVFIIFFHWLLPFIFSIYLIMLYNFLFMILFFRLVCFYFFFILVNYFFDLLKILFL